MLDKTYVEKLIFGLKTEEQIIDKLEEEGIEYERDEYSLRMNIRIPTDDGCIRIYESFKNEIVIQKMVWVKFQYSGVPTFFDTDSIF